jgi:hypothetical protein
MTATAPPPANYDEALVGDYTLPPLSLDPGKPVAGNADEARAAQAAWRERFAEGLYGQLPGAPDRLEIRRTPLSLPGCQRLAINVGVEDRSMAVDAALWLPPDATRPVPVIVALDFIGPLGTMTTTDYPLDPEATVSVPAWAGGGHGPLREVMRGMAGHRIPVRLLHEVGYAVLTSCYGSWVPDDPMRSHEHGLWPLLGLDRSNAPPGVVCLWSWAIHRLIDIAVSLPELDASRVALAGHSRLGKAALWAAANDQRVSALFLNESGCAGASLSSRNFGETLVHNRHGFPHWLLSAERAARAGLDTVDQHQLLAAIAPRKLYVASAVTDLWCDPRGEYLALKAAAPLWSAFGHPIELPDADDIFEPGQRLKLGQIGWHLREGGHELTPYDWSYFLDFMADGQD